MTRQATVEDAPVDAHRSTCLFCRYDDQEVNVVVLMTENFYVRKDNFPATTGHIEVVPKRHVVSLFDLTEEEMREAFSLMKKARNMLVEQCGTRDFTVGINDGRLAGRTVDHLHIHLIPRYDGDVDDPKGGIRQIFPECDPESWSS